ncbi:hypothetical protein [Vibrio campbellii]|uniref:hypothetical protein n=1 Tax=Vibrio campbellii TaxID=680 RepID=UPI00249BC46E|nr:hypothetical protein [Vibrio campbellii]
MRSLIELETFISVGEQAERMAKDSFSDEESESYKTAFVAHFKSLLRSKTYDFASDFLSDMAHDLNTEDPQYRIGPFFEFGYIKQFLKYLPSELQHALEVSKFSHGGAREGAGRPKKPTKQIRVPEQMAEDIKALCSVYPTHNPDCEDESDMTPKDHLSIEVLRVLDALKCYVEINIDSQSFEPFKY